MQLFEGFGCSAGPSRNAWAVTLREGGYYIGHCWFQLGPPDSCPEIGFLLVQSYWGQGYGRELGKLLVTFGLKDAGYRCLIATVDCDHTAAIRVLEQIGMTLDREERDDKGPYLVYSIKA